MYHGKVSGLAALRQCRITGRAWQQSTLDASLCAASVHNACTQSNSTIGQIADAGTELSAHKLEQQQAACRGCLAATLHTSSIHRPARQLALLRSQAVPATSQCTKLGQLMTRGWCSLPAHGDQESRLLSCNKQSPVRCRAACKHLRARLRRKGKRRAEHAMNQSS